MDPAKLTGVSKKLFSQIEFDSDEKLIYEIRKHPIGLLFVYVFGFSVSAMLFAAFIAATILLGNNASSITMDSDAIRVILLLSGAVLSLLAIGMTAIGAYIYQSNVVLVTNEKIAQVLYKSIFDRKISQLSVGDVQDVTVMQKGVLSRFFNYGTLVIETAGEQQNYTFTYTPHPYEAGKAIVSAHEQNLKEFGN